MQNSLRPLKGKGECTFFLVVQKCNQMYIWASSCKFVITVSCPFTFDALILSHNVLSHCLLGTRNKWEETPLKNSMTQSACLQHWEWQKESQEADAPKEPAIADESNSSIALFYLAWIFQDLLNVFRHGVKLVCLRALWIVIIW